MFSIYFPNIIPGRLYCYNLEVLVLPLYFLLEVIIYVDKYIYFPLVPNVSIVSTSVIIFQTIVMTYNTAYKAILFNDKLLLLTIAIQIAVGTYTFSAH